MIKLRWVALSLVMFGLQACSSSPSPLLPPTRLAPLKNLVEIKYGWSYQVGDGVGENYLRLPPVVVKDKMYLSDRLGRLVCLNAETGETVWKRDIARQVASGPVYDGERMLLGTSQGEVLALNPENGNLIWQSEVSSEVISAPASLQGVVVTRTVDGKVYGFDAKSGRRLWVYERNVPILTLRGTSRPLLADGVAYVGLDNGHLVALTLREGTVLWDVIIAVPQGRTEIERMVDVDATPMIMEGVVYAVAYQGRLVALRADSGRILWVRDISSYAGMQLDPYRLYVVDSEGMIIAMDRNTGATLWKQDQLLRRKLTRPELQKQYLVVADFNGFVHWLSRDTGTLQARDRVRGLRFGDEDSLNDDTQSRYHNVLATPVAAGNKLFAIDRRGILTAFMVTLP